MEHGEAAPIDVEVAKIVHRVIESARRAEGFAIVELATMRTAWENGVMPKNSRVIEQDGAFWFAIAYAASLLGTTASMVSKMVGAGVLTHRLLGRTIYVAEADVTRLRRSASVLKAELARQRESRLGGDGGSPAPTRRQILLDREDQHALPIADMRFPLRWHRS